MSLLAITTFTNILLIILSVTCKGTFNFLCISDKTFSSNITTVSILLLNPVSPAWLWFLENVEKFVFPWFDGGNSFWTENVRFHFPHITLHVQTNTLAICTLFSSAPSIGRISDESIGEVKNHDHRS